MTSKTRLLVHVGLFFVLPLLVAGSFFTAVALKDGEKAVSPLTMAAEECGVSDADLDLIREAEGSGYNGKGPGYLTYRTSDGRVVTIYRLGDDSWGRVGNGGCH